MTLASLILLSSFLLLWLLFDDDILRLYSSQVAIRQSYVEKSIELQNYYQQKKKDACQRVDSSKIGKTFLVNVQQENNDLRQYFYCKRNVLFKEMPMTNLIVGLYSYIDQQKLSEFSPHFTLPKNGAQSLQAQIYWFPESDNQWEIEGNVNGIILSAGNLTIIGKGKISGAIILNGQLKLENVGLSYDVRVVEDLFRQYSEWQFAEKSWYDFSAL